MNWLKVCAYTVGCLLFTVAAFSFFSHIFVRTSLGWTAGNLDPGIMLYLLALCLLVSLLGSIIIVKLDSLRSILTKDVGVRNK